MTEDELEIVVEASRNALFRELQTGGFNRYEYNMAIKALNKWAKEQLEMLRSTLH